MDVTVGRIRELVNEIAPFDTAEPYDNVGLLVGDPNRAVTDILVALDLTLGAIDEAEKLGAQLILTHHPVMFHGIKSLREDEPEGGLLCAIVRARLSLIVAHTNFDKAGGGVSETLALALGLDDPEPLEGGLVWVGGFDGSAADLLRHTRARINPLSRAYGGGQRLCRVAVCGGAGSEYWPIARDAGAGALLTGEVRHHDALAAVQAGLILIDAGHYETERPSVKALVSGLQIRANAVQYSLRVHESQYEPFA